MTNLYRAALWITALAFTAAFTAICIPPLIQHPDVLGAFAQGFVNPYSTGYSLDIMASWTVLLIWVIYERATLGVRHGWIAVLTGIVPGVAFGFALYLLMRLRQVGGAEKVV